MSASENPLTAPVTPVADSSSLADGEWHRLHPLTPLFKGGLMLIVVAGIIIANMRERLIQWFVNMVAPSEAISYDYGGDPIDWVLSNNLVVWALLGVLALVIVFVAIFWMIWRFQQFRITGDNVEFRKGIVFRSHRRAPLDRVQGVNLTRPFPARLIGLAKLEVVGAGADSNVPLEYLSTTRAEEVRADILRLASGARVAREGAAATHHSGVPVAGVHSGVPLSGAQQGPIYHTLNAGVSGLIEGVDLVDVVPESVIKIPTGRLLGSQLVGGVVWLVFFGLIFGSIMATIFLTSDGTTLEITVAMMGIGFFTGIPLVLAVIGIVWAQIARALRYSIAPTPDGLRITYGLLTTVTETLPPGRIFAVEVSQSLLWRPFGWWTIKINRMSGKSAAQQSSSSGQQFNVVLPVGKRADVERVLGLLLPDAPAADLPLVWDHGILGPIENDPYLTMPRRVSWRRPLSWKRQGYAVTEFGLLLRRGALWRKLAVFPLARLQGVSIEQGPISRAQRVASGRAHTVLGPVSGALVGLERDDAIAMMDGISRAAAAAAAKDHSHRWGEYEALDPVEPGVEPAPEPEPYVPFATFVPPAPPAPPPTPLPSAMPVFLPPPTRQTDD